MISAKRFAQLPSLLLTMATLPGLLSCRPETTAQPPAPQASPAEFVTRIQDEMVNLYREAETAYWVRATYITPDTALLAAKAGERELALTSRAVAEARRFAGVEMDSTTRRAIDRILLATAMPAPDDPAKQAELATIATDLEGLYGAGKACDAEGNCRQLPELKSVLRNSRDYDEQLQAWLDWRTISVPMRANYQRFVELTNDGARAFGYSDVGVMWKSGYDMPVADFEQEVERLWQQVAPLYNNLHCYVRSRLSDFYGADRVPEQGTIPAHLLGDMWAQDWSNIYPLVEPYPGASELNVSKALQKQDYTPLAMTKMAEGFFTSLGLPELPESFYQNSLLQKPRDRDVVCHASAWDMDNGNDPRIKQCVEPNAGELATLHHELGHIYYYLMYKNQPYLFKGGAHDGFHEAIGDTIVLAMTPAYLQKMGLVEATSNSYQATINAQMKMALEKIAFLPFGKLIDQWRWQVFSGATSAEHYNQDWWQLREQYQGVSAPVPRSEADFDPGAKYHIPANTPYTRYFLSYIIQFQFYKALCETAGATGPLHECSYYGSKAAGDKLGAMLAMGASQPWPEAMAMLTGDRRMDAAALQEYFQPLTTWLESQNRGKQCGW
ncbi:M2 family metallopeptidase [Halioxenophilus sp. WMMB6]|uniref:M2 family metallopeptidase n=1 Tax=Halioxenophilus sp. WMMB6 TaxID=3073815 RepID=UPI00295EDD3E|nr:M2 family metallopeptidase [Halioxenophilus sp. WMMB6]